MTCPSLGKIGRIFSVSTPDIIRGGDFLLVTEIQVKEQNGGRCQYGFQNFVGATAFFADADGAAIAFVGALAGSGELGRVQFSMAATGTDLIGAASPASFEQHFTDDNGLTIVQFVDALNVKDQLF